MTYVNVTVDIDIDEIVNNLSYSEKENLCQELIDDGHGPDLEVNSLEELLSHKSDTHTDRELGKLIQEIWSNRHFIDRHHIEEVNSMLRKRGIL